MIDIVSLIQQGSINLALFIPTAMALGALHGLEPGHSKTMMAAFIIAIRGTVAQAALLGISATISHTAIVWGVALTGMYYSRQWDAASGEQYLQLASAVLIIVIALWMMFRTWKHAHDHHQAHEHAHAHGHAHSHDVIEYQDAHERAHALEIERRFKHKHVTTGQIILFGLTGGLIPCPASITILLVCLQLKKIALGGLLVLCFSVGLAVTMVASGVMAALSVKHASKHWSGFGEISHKAPYFSGVLIILLGIYMGVHSLHAF